MSKLTILKFYAEWCNPCKALTHTMKDLELPYEVVPVDIDEDQRGLELGVRGIPSLVLVDEDNNVIDRLVGNITKEQIISRFGTLKE